MKNLYLGKEFLKKQHNMTITMALAYTARKKVRILKRPHRVK